MAKVTFPTADSPVAKATLAHCVSSCWIEYFDKRTQKDELELRKASVEAGSASGRCSSGHYEGLLMLAVLCDNEEAGVVGRWNGRRWCRMLENLLGRQAKASRDVTGGGGKGR